jgi:hypothetical protein
MAWTAEKKREDRAAKRLAKQDGTYTAVWDTADPKKVQPTNLEQLATNIKDNLFYWEMEEYKNAIPLAIEIGTHDEARIKQLIACSGASGIGKSFELRHTCRAAGLQENQDWGYITSSKDTAAVIEQIYDAILKQWKLICFDDHDVLFRSSVMPEVIKTGWGPERWIQRATPNTPPEGFSVKGLTCVFLSNKDITWFSKANVDLEAVFRRGQFRNVRVTKIEMFNYIIYRATHEADFFTQYSPTTKLQAVLYFNTHRKRLRNLSLHGLEAICHHYQHNMTIQRSVT